MNTTTLHYTQSGLDNVFLHNMPAIKDDAGDEVCTIPAMGLLHKAIAESIIQQPGTLTPKELRFLRTELGMTQNQLATIFGKDEQTVRRWEAGERGIPKAEETLLRLITKEQLDLGIEMSVEEANEAVVDDLIHAKRHNIARVHDNDQMSYKPQLQEAA